MKFNVATGHNYANDPIRITGMHNKVTVDFATPEASENGFSYSVNSTDGGLIKMPTVVANVTWAIVLPQDALTEGTEGSAYTNGYKGKRPEIAAIARNTYYGAGIDLDLTTADNSKIKDLSTVSENWTAEDGWTLTGTLSGNYKITIADGATVLLNGVTINGTNNSSYAWAGLNCNGDATIILKDGTTNTVKGFYEDYPGIHVPSGSTLIIKGETSGTGKLNASSNDDTNNSGAGIGGGWNLACGNIEIQGGVINATGSTCAAGIGSNNQACGNITISGGTVTATGGGNAAGIGGGFGGGCGDITIASTVTRVTATKGDGADHSIGRGRTGSIGTVTIGGVVGAITESPYTYPTPAPSAPTGAINGLFSVSSTKQVWFSQGNLQAYNATANSTSGWVWSFAENQWDYIGSSGSNQYINGSMKISKAGYVDLFNWVGTSASYDNYGIMYDNDTQGWGHEGTNFGNSTNDALKHDWGHNPITNGGNVADMWRTPTNDEWVYLINSRTTAAGTAPTINGTADARYAKAKLFETTRGLIIFPDTYVHPDGVAYPTGINAAGNTSWDGNQYSIDDWAKMEEAGCVFLPCAGIRVYYTQVNDKETRGFYASSTPNSDTWNQAKVMHFTDGTCVPNSNRYRRDAGPVRLVQDAD